MYLFLLFMLGIISASSAICNAYRYCNHESYFKRSFCEYCYQPLKFWQLIPILGYIFQFGHCSFCKHRIPLTSTFFELFYGLFFAYYFYYFPFTSVVYYVFFYAWFLLLAIEDYYTLTVNLDWLLGGIAIALIWNFKIVVNCVDLYFIPSLILALVLLFLTKFHLLGGADSIIFYFLFLLYGINSFIVIISACIVSIGFFIIKRTKKIAFIPSIFIAYFCCLFSNWI